ncbi:MAG: hypothetical protein J4203_02035 [Candidatus Diapherotrites archaeon]|uniref:Uncharacterized protein n=1 Tax=Candidatus Iainarchaeum sp. TaxID=3101447 RepID=A0A8T4L7I6_9ARCH|nr:hypothetical protein [Candidatus Diapherotrites archaeon]
MRLPAWHWFLLFGFILFLGCNYQKPGSVGPLYQEPKVVDQQQVLRNELTALGCPNMPSLDECHFSKAVQARLPEKCGAISAVALQDRCYHELALTLSDESVCRRIQDSNSFDDCLLRLGKTLKGFDLPCETLKSPENRARCVKEIREPLEKKRVEQYPFIDLCNALPEGGREACTQTVKAERMDERFCDPFMDPATKDKCLLAASKFLSKYSLCNQVSGEAVFDACITNKAIASASSETCKEAKSKDSEWTCMKDFGVQTGNAVTCRKIPVTTHSGLRLECLDGAAFFSDEPGVCEDIRQLDKQGFCFGRIAVKRNDFRLCAGIKTGTVSDLDPFLARDSCYVHVAEHLALAEACEPVNYASRKATCLTNVAQGVQADSVEKPVVSIPGGPKTCNELNGRVCPTDANCMSAVIATIDSYVCCLTKCKLPDECTTPADCDDGEASTVDECRGTPRKCVNTVSTACVSGNGSCPAGCHHGNDSDCPADDCNQDSDCDTADTLARCQKGTCVKTAHPYTCTYGPHPNLVC